MIMLVLTFGIVISLGYDQSTLTNNSGQNGSVNNANIIIEFRKQSDKYTPRATNPTVKVTSNGTVPNLGSPETYIANKSDLPTYRNNA